MMYLSNILQLISTLFYVISTGALIITLCVLIWYAYETRALRKETVKQTELSQRPFVMIFEAEFSDKIMYKNSGQGIALNIEIKPLKYKDYTITFEKEPVLGSNEVPIYDINPVAIDNKTGKICPPKTIPFTPYELRTSKSDNSHILDIFYENIEKKRYQTKVKISKEGFVFLDSK